MSASFKSLSLLLVLFALASNFANAQGLDAQELELSILDFNGEGEAIIYSGPFSLQNISSIQDGFISVPVEYENNEEDYNVLPALQLGAQFLAAQAVSEGLFTTSVANVSQVYSFIRTDPAVVNEDFPTGNITEEGYQYAFNVELVSAQGESVRVSFVVLVDPNSSSYLIDTYEFDYLADLEGQVSEVDVFFDNNNFEYDVNDWDNDVESELFNQEAIVVEGLPESGESFDYDANLVANNWSRVNVSERINNDDFLYLLKYGANYTVSQGNANDNLFVESVMDYTITEVHNVYEKNSTNGTEFKFDVTGVSQGFQTLRFNYQLNYNPESSSVDLYGWAIESIINPVFN